MRNDSGEVEQMEEKAVYVNGIKYAVIYEHDDPAGVVDLLPLWTPDRLDGLRREPGLHRVRASGCR